jgi:hypothetical protein
MRLCLIILALLLSACASQRRPVYEPYDPWADYQPSGRTYYDHNYVPPARRGASALVRQAISAESAGRDDRARVDYHLAFRRDRWHVEANTRYQDLMLRNGLYVILWQEYLDLWELNPERGDAFWFHLRPALMQRQDEAPPRRGRAPSEAERAKLEELLRAIDQMQDTDAARQAVNEALLEHDWPELHRAGILLCPDDELPALAAMYASRAGADPSDGNALALHALALAPTEPQTALRMLRDGVVLELPGYWLYHTLAELCAEHGDAVEGDNRDSLRQMAGWYLTAEALFAYCARAGDGVADDALASVRAALAEPWTQELDLDEAG